MTTGRPAAPEPIGPAARAQPDVPWPSAIGSLLPAGHAGPGAAEYGTGLVAGATVWPATPATVYHFGSGSDADAAVAVGRFVDWLQRLGQAAVFATPTVAGSSGRWLVVVGPDLGSAATPERHAEPAMLAAAVGTGLRAIHELAPSLLDGVAARSSSSDGWSVAVERCRAAVADGAVDPALVPEPYNRYQPEQLLTMLTEPLQHQPSTTDPMGEPVLCHGGADPARFLVEGGRFVGLDRWDGPLVADRHIDLAAAHLGVQRHLGGDAVFGFYEAYGLDPDLILLDRAVLAAVLMTRSADRPAWP